MSHIDKKTFKRRVDYFVKDEMVKKSFYLLLDALEKNENTLEQYEFLFSEIFNYVSLQGVDLTIYKEKYWVLKTSQ